MRKLHTIATVAAMVSATVAFAGEETRPMDRPALVVMEHLGGTLAINVDTLVSVFYGAGPDQPARLRFNLEGGSNKTVEPPDAERLWTSLREGPHAGRFVWVSHLGGTLGIPVASIQSLYRSGTGDAVTLRINYPGDPQGKTLAGEEAERVWRSLTP